MVPLQVERTLKFLQITAIVIALLAPWIYFVGYAYDWGYLDSFAIERQMFFKAPQKYFGLAYVVFVEVAGKLINAIPDGLITLVCLAISIAVIVVHVIKYWVHRAKLWPKLYMRYSNWAWRKRGIITSRFVGSLLSAYFVSVFFVIIPVGFAYIFLLFVLPALIGYSNGQKDAKKLKKDWHPVICTAKSTMVGCTQLLEASQVIVIGKLVAASEKYVAIFDGSSVQIYSLRNRDIKTVLPR